MRMPIWSDERNPAVNSMLDRLERLSKVSYAQMCQSTDISEGVDRRGGGEM
jgi:hypothetical protein